MTDETRGGVSAAGDPGQAVPGAPEPAAGFFSDFVDLVYGVFFSPVETLRKVASRPVSPTGAALLGFLVVAFINGLASGGNAARALQEAVKGLGGAAGSPFAGPTTAPPNATFVALTAMGAVLLAPIGLFFKAGALSLVSAFLGGRGDARRLFACFSLTYLPSLAGIPFALLLGRRPGSGLLLTLIGLGILAWRLVLDIIAIREVHSLGAGSAVAAALIPLGVFAAVIVLVVALWLGVFMSALGPVLQSGFGGAG